MKLSKEQELSAKGDLTNYWSRVQNTARMLEALNVSAIRGVVANTGMALRVVAKLEHDNPSDISPGTGYDLVIHDLVTEYFRTLCDSPAVVEWAQYFDCKFLTLYTLHTLNTWDVAHYRILLKAAKNAGLPFSDSRSEDDD